MEQAQPKGYSVHKGARMRHDNYELEQTLAKIMRFADCKGGGGPQIDYAAIQRQQQQEQERLRVIAQAKADEEYRVQGVSDYIDYMYDNPEQTRHQAPTGRYFTAVSPGSVPNKILSNYQSDKSITPDSVKANPDKYFDRRTSQASIKPGKIRFGRMADQSSVSPGGLLGTGGQEQKTLLGA